ncbi:CRISPR-associated helicase/endonuclease Cas3 [Rhodoferax antarcticus]|uniref:CRISPR-associated helicase Cas3 n=1 Tax=Rhodoferax antarcticus ANT.BR TaxID=1111071 RepID=A0A1Q8YHY4_9BURK|nr:CRISPR-associated helicase/endonuclease Cas3 [Rhodoferax antarcticus]APW45304.1 CRISPR-associated helicase/endonuclease Cas3 [Rhodoferax antarcticus]OLP07606.1 CRISPR-associated helicase Cas3 [Rhodoferax antarcticus ANT.BR]
MAEPLAHSGGHLLTEHLRTVAALAAGFSQDFEHGAQAQRWAYSAGLWHDLGKYRPGFQRYVRLADNTDAHIEGKVGGREKTHSAAGALWAMQQLNQPDRPYGNILAYLIAGHHAGLDDWDGGLKERLHSEDAQLELKEALDARPPANILAHGDLIAQIPGGAPGFALWVRMLFSCLVDADFLDTEAHFDANKPARRDGFPTLAQMRQAFDAHMAGLPAANTSVNTLRADVLRQCRTKAALPAGFFSLTVPTGGGKTLSSLAFALEHAQAHGKRRVIYAIPYTSIIEQTADVFREVFKALGDEVLIEHHSQADAAEKDETARSRLACENWDAPLVVTTNVQLFESLFAAKTSRCRKLHNLVNSVIVLDEAQQLPPAFLQPILDVLNLLVTHYGVTVVLCTATQPALNSTTYFDANKNLRGLENVREIIDHPDALFDALKRVDVTLPPDWTTPTAWEDIAAQLSAEDCVLAIVSTRKAARELQRLMPADTLHLSALMCGAHRKEVIDQIKARLKAKREGCDQRPLRVVSTQLVEAGVDIDFPVVYRALAGLDSIAQAAGRCNREGRLNGKGRVVVFVPPEKPPLGHLRKGADACISTLRGQAHDPLARALFDRYFKEFYHSVDLDAKEVVKKLTINDRRTLSVQFRTAAEAFHLIEDEDAATVVVRYACVADELDMLLATLAVKGPKRWLMRKLQRYTVSIRKRVADKMLEQGDLKISSVPGLYMQIDASGLYDEKLGLYTEGVPFDALGNVF